MTSEYFFPLVPRPVSTPNQYKACRYPFMVRIGTYFANVRPRGAFLVQIWFPHPIFRSLFLGLATDRIPWPLSCTWSRPPQRPVRSRECDLHLIAILRARAPTAAMCITQIAHTTIMVFESIFGSCRVSTSVCDER